MGVVTWSVGDVTAADGATVVISAGVMTGDAGELTDVDDDSELLTVRTLFKKSNGRRGRSKAAGGVVGWVVS